jgi:DNA-binding beta-propeller fold protein YncE
LNENKITKTFDVGGAPEKMIIVGENLYVAMSNGFNLDNRLLILNKETGVIKKTLTFSDTHGTNSLVQASNGSIYVACEGVYLGVDDGRIFEIKNEQIANTFICPNGTANLAINKSDKLFFSTNLGIFTLDTQTKQLQNIYDKEYVYGLVLNKDDKTLYASLPKDFSSAGKLLKMSEDGTVVKEYTTGVVPAQIYIRP